MEAYVEDWVAEFAATADRSPDAMWLYQSNGQVVYANGAASGLTGAHNLDEAADVVHGGVSHHDPAFRQALAERGTWTGDFELMNPRTGEAVPVWATAYVVTGRHARNPVAAIVCRDLRGRFELECRLRNLVDDAAAHAREQRAVADLSRSALTASPAQVLNEVADAALLLTGTTYAVVFEPSFPDRSDLVAVSHSGPRGCSDSVSASRRSLPASAMSAGEAVVCSDRDEETRFETDAMVAHGLRSGAAVVIDGHGEPWGVLAVYGREPKLFSDGEVAFLQTVAGVASAAIRRHDLENELRRRTMHDPLTGLPNRLLVRQRIDDVRVRGNPHPIAILVIDLDNFKTINDTLGHAVGDRALQIVADVLTSAAGVDDTVSRFGGDEFVVLHKGPDPVGLASKLMDGFAEPFDVDGRRIPVSASVGVAVDTEFTADADDLFRRADAAMYDAKNAGASGYSVSSGYAVLGDTLASAFRSHVQHNFEFEQ